MSAHHRLEEYHETFKTLLAAIKSKLKAKGVDVSNEFITLMTKLAAINPTNKFLIKQQMVKSELNRMEKIVVSRVMDMTEISRKIIELQFYYKIHYYNRDDSIEAHREEIDAQIGTLMDDIKSGIPKVLSHHDYWYAKLIGATIIEADLGPATQAAVIRETESALKSVFPKEDMDLLSTMTEKEREAELYHLMHIAIGIRLYMKAAKPKTYGKYIENLPIILPKRIEQVHKLIIQIRHENVARLIKYTAIVQPYFLKQFSFKVERREVSREMIEMRQGLAMVHQILIYLKELTDDLHHERDLCTNYITTFSETLLDLRKSINNSSNVPSLKVHPKFLELSSAWRDLQNASMFIESIDKLVNYLMKRSATDLVPIDELVESKIVGKKIPTEDEFFNFPKVKLPEDKFALAKRIDFREDFSPLQMNFMGFCIHSLVKGVGLTVISNPNIGVFNWKNKHMLVSSPKAAIEFRKDPESFIRKALAVARRWPELIGLLNIDRDVFDPSSISEADRSKKTTNVLIANEAGTQTELHPVPQRIVENYTWNEWDLRRRGLILSKIHKCVTHGTQTHWHSMCHNAAVQTGLARSLGVQTNKNVHTELGLNHFYIYGLRGSHCGIPPHVVELTPEDPMGMKCIIPTEIPPEITFEDMFKDAGEHHKFDDHHDFHEYNEDDPILPVYEDPLKRRLLRTPKN